jgi:eukaryotic-like serine/threonine-protein kinase
MPAATFAPMPLREPARQITPTADGTFLDVQASLAGRYSLMRELGRGGMAIVYLAHEVRLDRLVALKVLPGYQATPAMRERFLQEARTAARLSHPNIVPIYAVDEARDFVFFAMSYVDGETLGARIAQRGKLTSGDAVAVLRDIAHALAYAHRQGIVHRDIKPGNILLERGSNRTFLADFGIAHVETSAAATGVGQLIGTPDYMSPEQASGESVDGRSDIYSLGLVGYCALSGRLPFTGDSLGSILAQRIATPAPQLLGLAPSVPPRVARVVDRCLTTAPADRYQTGEAVAEALEAAAERPRRLPEALEEWIHSVDELRFVQFMIAPLVAAFVFPTLRTLVNSIFDQGLIPWEGGFTTWPGYLLYIAIPCSVYAVVRARAVRRVIAYGFGIEDLRAALAVEINRLRELAHDSARGMQSVVARIKSGSGGLALMAIGLTALDSCADQWRQEEQILFYIIWTLLLGVVLAARSRSNGRSSEAFDAETRAWFWNRWPGQVVAWLAAIGIRGRGEAMATHRPTEVALGGAAEALFEALPGALRRDLEQVPAVIGRLQDRARLIRREIDDLQAVEASPQPARAHVMGAPNEAEVLFRQRRERAQQALTDVVAALERIRMSLLRLQSGAIGTSEISADIAAADEVCRSADALSAGIAEVERVVDPWRVRSDASIAQRP